jgi:porin
MDRKTRIGWAVACAAASVLSVSGDLARAQVEPLDDVFVAVPLEPDDAPYRPETPRPAPPATQPAAQPPVRGAPEGEQSDPVLSWRDDLVRPFTDVGITPGFSLTADYGKNLRGGASTNGSAFNHLLDLSFTVDTNALLDLKGGTVFIDFQQQHGESASVDSGDFQDVSAINGGGITQISEAWYEQKLWDEKLRVKVGKIDAAGEFAYALNGGEFINGSMGWTATNAAIPTYPDPSFGGNVFVTPCEHFYAGAGLYDGTAQEGYATGGRGPSTLFGSPSDLYAIGEIGVTWDVHGQGMIGRLAGGAWHHTGTFEQFTGGTQDGASGYYLTFDQTILRENPGDEDDAQGVGVFVIYDTADADVFEIDHHLAAGVAWTGAIDGRDADVVGLGVSWVHFSDDAGFDGDSETAIEAFYRVQLTPYFSVKPDVQYILDPSGGEDDALVASVRLELTF